MPRVYFSHTKKQEKEYLTDLLEEKEWFESENFPVFLPKNQIAIETELKKENNVLKKKINWLRQEWKKIEKDYFKIIKDFKHKKLLSSYKCHISRFGPEGKYHRPNFLFVRLRTVQDKKRILETIGHELFHLLFADLFEKNKLTYREKEGMVDALILNSELSKLFPKYEAQSIGVVRKRLLEYILKI